MHQQQEERTPGASEDAEWEGRNGISSGDAADVTAEARNADSTNDDIRRGVLFDSEQRQQLADSQDAVSIIAASRELSPPRSPVPSPSGKGLTVSSLSLGGHRPVMTALAPSPFLASKPLCCGEDLLTPPVQPQDPKASLVSTTAETVPVFVPSTLSRQVVFVAFVHSFVWTVTWLPQGVHGHTRMAASQSILPSSYPVLNSSLPPVIIGGPVR